MVEIPDRTQPGDFHYHVCNYPYARPFQTYGPLEIADTRRSGEFYSLRADLHALQEAAEEKGLTALLTSEAKTPVGWDIWSLRLGDRPNHRVLFTGGIHGCEWIGVEIVYLIAEYLIKNYAVEPGSYRARLLKDLVDNAEIWFVPMVNPEGHFHTLLTDRYWRKNRRRLSHAAGSFPEPRHTHPRIGPDIFCLAPQSGSNACGHFGGDRQVRISQTRAYFGVDINRNFAVPEWGVERYRDATFRGNAEAALNRLRLTSADPSHSKNYCGPEAESEPETRAVAALYRDYGFRVAIDYHSYFQAILHHQDAAEDQEMKDKLTCLANLIQTKVDWELADGNALGGRANHWKGQDREQHYESGTDEEVVGYTAGASSSDYAWERGVRASFTIELDPKGPNRGLGVRGFRLPENRIQAVFEKNIRAALGVIRCVGTRQMEPGKSLTILRKASRRKRQAYKEEKGCCEVFKIWDVFGRGNVLP